MHIDHYATGFLKFASCAACAMHGVFVYNMMSLLRGDVNDEWILRRE